SCAEALDISGGGGFEVGLSGARPDYALSCGEVAMPDVAFSFELDEPRDVRLTASGRLARTGDENATLGLLKTCADVGPELKCSQGFPGQIRARALAPGKYYVVAGSMMSAAIVLDATFSDATDAPANPTCEKALDVSAGGRFEGSMVDAGDDEELACGADGAV